MWGIAAVTAAVAAAASASAGQAPLAGAGALRPFFQALVDLEKHRAGPPVRIIQIGDSHTANDAFSGRMRELLQKRFGAVGRGWMPAGIPFKYYRPALVAVTEAGWRHVTPGSADKGDLRFGLDASVAEPETPDAHMMLTSTEADGFDRAAVEFVARPHGAPLALRIDDGADLVISTISPRIAPRVFEKRLLHAAHQIDLAAPQNSGQQVLGWAVERYRPGILYENHGSIGASAALLPRLNPAAVSFELDDRRPALLVVAFGTNEGFKDTLDLAEYAALFRGAVVGLRRQAPGTAVLVLGPPDGNRRASDCIGTPATCGEPAGCSWVEPRNLDAVRDIQQRIARRLGWAFWDWSAAMGGRCSVDRWLAHDPSWAMADHVHLSKDGYMAAADLLFAALMTEYDQWKNR